MQLSVNFFHKKIVSDSLCPMCGLLPETTGHIIWRCDSSKAVCMECSRKVQKLSIAEDDGMCLFEQLLDKLDEDKLLLVSCLARSIWLRRNSVVFGGQPSSSGFLVQNAVASFANFQQARQVSRPEACLQPEHPKWQKPPSGVLKVNQDAALDHSSHTVGVGCLLEMRRDWLWPLCAPRSLLFRILQLLKQQQHGRQSICAKNKVLVASFWKEMPQRLCKVSKKRGPLGPNMDSCWRIREQG